LGMRRIPYRIAQLPNLMRPDRTAGNLSMGGRPNPFAAARLANRTQQEQGNSPGSGRHMSPNAIMNVRPTLHYVGTCAGEASVGPRNGGSGARSGRPDVLQPRDHQAALSLYRDIGGA